MWHLFVQHSAAAPDYKSIGWALLTSADLIRWDWAGAVIPPDDLGQAYSGSIVQEGDALAAYLTRHDGERQRQVRLESRSGCHWLQGAPLGPQGRNVRDPFVFFCRAAGEWRMLLAEPCDWADWATDPPSQLSVWRQDGAGWTHVSFIGPWMAPGIMWEVPVLVDFGERQALIVSLVDRRDDQVRCSVHGWVGRFDGSDFVRDREAGHLLDLGPDFYAAIVEAGGKLNPLLVAWASSWATARKMPWPGEIGGGPITLPRRLSLDPHNGRLLQRLAVDLAPARRASYDGKRSMKSVVDGEGCQLALTVDPAGVTLSRSGSPLLDWHQREALPLTEPQTIAVHEDAGLIEVFVEPAGLSATVFLPGARL
jgi:sucrose-6-phosphate hydrolase SacC (GH32 family)